MAAPTVSRARQRLLKKTSECWASIDAIFAQIEPTRQSPYRRLAASAPLAAFFRGALDPTGATAATNLVDRESLIRGKKPFKPISTVVATSSFQRFHKPEMHKKPPHNYSPETLEAPANVNERFSSCDLDWTEHNKIALADYVTFRQIVDKHESIMRSVGFGVEAPSNREETLRMARRIGLKRLPRFLSKDTKHEQDIAKRFFPEGTPATATKKNLAPDLDEAQKTYTKPHPFVTH